MAKIQTCPAVETFSFTPLEEKQIQALPGDSWKLKRCKSTPLNGPRTVYIPRSERGFGFTLRHFIVYPPEPATARRVS
ncbi:RHG21-like protein [Mya arenaria]|uniref:RHG21-like protein n=1 Tax=Mya arenaria TaxID=6604 RepID=A0ABY7D9K1_MYAAR|nr:RHG21-like protein [Mya arenaria]